LNEGKVYDCNNSPLNAGGTSGYYTGGTVCSPSSGTICNICSGNYNSCPHNAGTSYGGSGGTVCSPSGGICNICHTSYSSCPHYAGTSYGGSSGTVCSPYSGSICNICSGNYSRCPHQSGTTYGQTWISGTPNNYHLHSSSCSYHYTTHSHTSSCSYTDIVNGSTQTSELFGIGEYEAGGSVIIPCYATCNVKVIEDYSRTSSGTNINTSTVFAYAETNIDDMGYDLVVWASPSISFTSGSTILGSLSLSKDTNVWTDPAWIWDSQRSTSSKSCAYSSITATGYGSFQAPDAVIWPPVYWQPNTRSLTASVTF
jgi:hypothetical protein